MSITMISLATWKRGKVRPLNIYKLGRKFLSNNGHR